MAFECVAEHQDSSKPLCSVEDCTRPVRARGYCSTHWARWRKHGDPLAGAFQPLPALCEIAGCEKKPHTRRQGVAVCNQHWQMLHKYGAPVAPPRQPQAKCCVENCGNNSRTKYGQFCEKHYMRLRRNGDTNRRKPEERITHSSGYVLLFRPEHPLTKRSGRVREYEHRVVFYDTHGAGPFSCHWCGVQVSWSDMHVDHVNAVRDDNRLENLVASCARCNQGRAREAVDLAVRKRSPLITFNGVSKRAVEWARELGITTTALRARLRRWPTERALTEANGRT